MLGILTYFTKKARVERKVREYMGYVKPGLQRLHGDNKGQGYDRDCAIFEVICRRAIGG